MLPLILALFLLPQAQPPEKKEAPATQPAAKIAETAKPVSDDLGAKLLRVKRIYVESFGDSPIDKQIHAMIIDALSSSKRFIVTENKDKADAILKGVGLEKTLQEFHSSSEATVVRHAAIEDSSASTETINDARMVVRLVDADGDVIWTSTQESKGAKYKGASADVADKIVKQLLRDLEKLEKRSASVEAVK